jgi:hypothetical protein
MHVCTCVYVCVCVCVYVHVCMCMCVCTCVYVYVCLCVYVWMYMCVCLCVYVYVCICMYVYVCMYVCMYMCVCVYDVCVFLFKDAFRCYTTPTIQWISMEHWWNDNDGGRRKYSEKNLCSSQIPHGPAWDRKGPSAVKSWKRLTAWAWHVLLWPNEQATVFSKSLKLVTISTVSYSKYTACVEKWLKQKPLCNSGAETLVYHRKNIGSTSKQFRLHI